MSSFIPETAPFNEQQRAWLNGFFSGLMGLQTATGDSASPATMLVQAGIEAGSVGLLSSADPVCEEEFPWHDSSLPLPERMELAKDKSIDRRLMAAMAQLDCGSCGYVCQSYAEAIASGDEKNLTLCSPGGKETKQMIKLLLKDGTEASNGKSNGTSSSTAVEKVSGFNRQNPWSARLIESRPLNKAGSTKDVRHVVIDLSGSGLKYEVGDALGVYPVNCGELAAAIVAKMGAEPTTRVRSPLGVDKPLIDALMHDCCLRDPSDELLELLASRVEDRQARQTLERMLSDGAPGGFDVLDAFGLAHHAHITATEVVEVMSPLNPRLYSIASSMKKVGTEVHLTVGKVVYDREGRMRKGAASHMLAERLALGESVRVFVQPNHGGFTVPKSDQTPMIMIGPGTGIAPFMGFLQERQARKATGKNWLFFGDQHQASDFLYEDELANYRSSGLLHRLDTAFSRDGESKVYVQNRMQERARELWDWLESGAHVYVCGDASRMAADVESALQKIIGTQGKRAETAAKQYIRELSESGRYVRDVY
ncbi:MAG TPA: sulfite reductase subunit alpha [Planctomycetaceae bacterium]|nr:sulfite reductase subunit alpha [Planctomycetaceae bacterium]